MKIKTAENHLTKSAVSIAISESVVIHASKASNKLTMKRIQKACKFDKNLLKVQKINFLNLWENFHIYLSFCVFIHGWFSHFSVFDLRKILIPDAIKSNKLPSIVMVMNIEKNVKIKESKELK